MTTIPESHRDLLRIDVLALATLGQDGYPQVTATWFLAEGDVVRISLNTIRHKFKNLREHPECSAFFLDPANPYRTLEIRARAEITPDPDYAFAAKVGQKYNTDMRTIDKPGDSRVVVTLQPVKVNTYG